MKAQNALLYVLVLCCLGVSGCGFLGDGNVIAEMTLKSGETQKLSIKSNAPEQIGIYCIDRPEGGAISMKRLKGGKATGSSWGTGFWASRRWEPYGGKMEFNVVNEAKNTVRFIIFRGSSPPEAYW